MHALVVDDSRAMRMILRRALVRLGFTVSEAADGQQALDALAAADVLPDVALVDWNMPVLDGLELVRAVRREPAYRGTALVVVTTESEQAQVARALAAGAQEYVVKPFGDAVLEEKLGLLGLLRPVGA